jgi:hypothetical protein
MDPLVARDSSLSNTLGPHPALALRRYRYGPRLRFSYQAVD